MVCTVVRVTWQRFSVRRGKTTEDGPFEGVPPHLESALLDWFTGVAHAAWGFDADLLERARLRFHLSGTRAAAEGHQLAVVTTWARGEPENLLDLIDWTLHDGQDRIDRVAIERRAERVEEILSTGASVYTVMSDGLGLVERIHPAALAQFAHSTGPHDEVTEELAVAWSEAYGLHPDASDAWDHAIKAVEAALKPIVVPNNASATLGHIVGEIRANPLCVTFALADNGLNQQTQPADTLIGMLRLVWPNPDRHQGPNHRTPDLQEARGIVQLAVTLVQWVRGSVLS
jgi:hypothetical protein